MININFHNLIGVKIKNPPKIIKKFCKEEFYYFIQKKKIKRNIEVNFKDKIILPKNIKILKQGFFYDDITKTFYFKKDNKFLSYNVKSYFKDKIFINIEKGYNIWFFLYAIENSLYFLMSKRKFCMLHAGAVKKNQSAHIFLGPQGSGKTFYILNKIIKGYSFLGDEYIFINKDAQCLSFPRPVNFKKFHKKHYILAFKHNWKSLNFSSKYKWILKEFFKTLLFRSNWKPMIRLRINKIYPYVKIIKKTKINKLHNNFKKRKGFINQNLNLIMSKTVLEDIQFEIINRINPLYKYIINSKDKFIRNVIADIKKYEKSKIEIIKSFIYKVKESKF